MKTSLLAPLSALLLALGITASASAQEPVPTAELASVSLTLGYGVFVGDDGGTDFNPYSLGFGVRGGYTLDMNVYVGGFFNYFLGESQDVGGVDVKANVVPLGIEGGYDLLAGPIVLRPSLGLGAALLMSSASGDFGGTSVDESNTETRLLLAPGVNALYMIDSLFVGGEVRYYWVPSEESTDAFLIALNVGTTL